MLIAATTPQSDGSNLFQAEGQSLDLVFSEALGGSISEVNLEIALLFGGGASDGDDNLPTWSAGANPIALTTTNTTNDTLRVTFNTDNTANADWLRVGTHTVEIANGADLDDAVGNDGNASGAAVTITGDTNDAPVLDISGTMTLTDVAEDDTNPPGDTVAAIIATAGDQIADADVFPVEGIAVTGIDNTNGTWQYDAGSGWTAFGAVSDASATLLDAGSLIRFVPNANYNGSGGQHQLPRLGPDQRQHRRHRRDPRRRRRHERVQPARRDRDRDPERDRHQRRAGRRRSGGSSRRRGAGRPLDRGYGLHRG